MLQEENSAKILKTVRREMMLAKEEVLTTLNDTNGYYIMLTDEENAQFTLAIYRKNALQMLFKTAHEEKHSGFEGSYAIIKELLLDLSEVLFDIDKLFYQILLKEFGSPAIATMLLDTKLYHTQVDIFQKCIWIEKVI